MRSTALTTSLLLAAAAALASGAVLTPGSGRVVGLGPTCRNIGAQEAAIARALGTTAALRSLSNSETAVAPRDLSLSPRDPSGQYNLCGILRGDQRSAAFTLDASHRWNAYWVDDRPIIGGAVLLWELDANDDHLLDSEPMTNRYLRPFKPGAGRQYALELRVSGPQAESAIISWYFATQ